MAPAHRQRFDVAYPAAAVFPDAPQPGLELALDDMHTRLDAWRSVAGRLAQRLNYPRDFPARAADALMTITELVDVTPRYRSWMRGRVLDDLVGIRGRPYRRDAPDPRRQREPLTHLELD